MVASRPAGPSSEQGVQAADHVSKIACFQYLVESKVEEAVEVLAAVDHLLRRSTWPAAA